MHTVHIAPVAVVEEEAAAEAPGTPPSTPPSATAAQKPPAVRSASQAAAKVCGGERGWLFRCLGVLCSALTIDSQMFERPHNGGVSQEGTHQPKSVRWNLQNNLFFAVDGPIPDQDVRTPPGAKPKVSLRWHGTRRVNTCSPRETRTALHRGVHSSGCLRCPSPKRWCARA